MTHIGNVINKFKLITLHKYVMILYWREKGNKSSFDILIDWTINPSEATNIQPSIFFKLNP